MKTYHDTVLLAEYNPPEDPPPAPSARELHTLLERDLSGTESVAAQADMILRFDGRMTTDSGAEGQNLAVTLTPDTKLQHGDRRGTHRSAEPQTGPTTEAPLLSAIARARADLRSRLTTRLPDHDRRWSRKDLPAEVEFDRAPLLLGGGCWEKASQYIALYGDLDQHISWYFFNELLAVGHSFAHQLVPMLADDIWLRTRIMGETSYQVDGVTYQHALDVMYVVDMGVQTATDESGEIVHHNRSYIYGNIIYVPGVGPVALHQWELTSLDMIMGGSPAPTIETVCTLVAFGIEE